MSAHQQAGGFSAADAYNQPLQSSSLPPREESQRPLSNPAAAYGYSRGATRAQNDDDDDEDDDDDDEDEDWNVYDDFNNARPIPSQSHQDSFFGQRQSGAGWSQHQFQDVGLPEGGAQPLGTPYSDYPTKSLYGDRETAAPRDSRLIPASAFGFDASNMDPRTSKYMRDANGEIVGAAPVGDEDGRLGVGGSGTKGAASESGIELITVPALGNEYSEEEVKRMRRSDKRRSKARKRKEGARKWARGEKKIGGWLGPRCAVFFVFISLVLLGIMLYFVIPRVPTFQIQTTTPLEAVPDGNAMQTHSFPTNFSMNMNINLRGNNKGGWVASNAHDMTMEVTDLTTGKKVGKGQIDSKSFPGRKSTVFQFPVSFSYASLNSTGDETWKHWINACGPKYQGTTRDTLNLGFTVKMSIQGLIGSKGQSTQLPNLECPFTLQADQT